MNTILSFVRRHPVISFAALAYLLSWWPAPFIGGRILPYGPALAAVIVLSITAGKPGLARLWKRLSPWRAAWYWYAIGPAIIAIYTIGGFGLNILFGAVVINRPHLPEIGTILSLLLLGGLWEEPGWSGYALPKLQEHFRDRPNGALFAALGVGVLRAIWHLPLFIYGHIPWFDVVLFEVTVQLIIAWLFNGSGGSVIVVMWFHLSSNIFGSVFNPSFTGSDFINYYALFVALAIIIALGILWRSGLQLKQENAQDRAVFVD